MRIMPYTKKYTISSFIVFLMMFSVMSCGGGGSNASTTASTTTTTSTSTTSPNTALTIKVSGNHFVNGSGQTIRLLGVNRDGPNYMCTGGQAPASDARPATVFDGPSDDASIAAMKAWRINVVRLPLNESCWLGINGVDPIAGGAAYQQAIKDYVNRLHAQGLYAIIELYANAPGTLMALTQQNGPDADHAAAFWASVATSFRDDPAVLFDLFNEPILNPSTAAGGYKPATTNAWDCWRDGGCTSTVYDSGQPMLTTMDWQMTGMQQLLDAVRATGATQPVLLGGVNWTLDMSGWLNHLPTDPAKQIAASIHLYNFSGGGFTSSWTFDDWKRDPAVIAQSYPVVTGELGIDNQDYKFINDYMSWADSIGVSYIMYTWIRWHENGQEVNTGITVIKDYAGTPSPMGQGFHDHLQTVGYP